MTNGMYRVVSGDVRECFKQRSCCSLENQDSRQIVVILGIWKSFYLFLRVKNTNLLVKVSESL